MRRSIGGCSRLIRTGILGGDDLARIFFNRGIAYFVKGQYDASIEDYDQTIRLNPKHVEALIDRGIIFNGKGQHVSLGRNLPFFRNVTAGTLSAWIHPKGGGEERYPRIIMLSVHRDEPTTKTRAKLSLNRDENGQRFKLVASARPTDHGRTDSLVTDNYEVPPDRWTHVAAVFDFEKDSIELYVDGTSRQKTDSAGFEDSRVADTPAFCGAIGSEEGGSEKFFGGLIDDVRIYDRALTGDEVKELYKKTSLRPN